MIEDTFNLTKKSYEPGLFVDREKELSLISSRVGRIEAGLVEETPIMNFWGIRGIGKSWMLNHVRYKYEFTGEESDSYSVPTLSLYHCFNATQQGSAIGKVTESFVQQINQQLERKPSKDTELLKKRIANKHSADVLEEILTTVAGHYVLVVLLDQVELESFIAAEEWSELERLLLEPLVLTNRVVMVIAGRRKIAQWHRFEVRRRVLNQDFTRLDEFSEEDVERQIGRLYENVTVNISKLYGLTAGSPLLVDTLLERMVKLSPAGGLTDEWFEDHRSDLLPSLINSAIEYLFHGIKGTVIDWLKALSILRFYRLEAVKHMVPSSGKEEQPLNYYLILVRTLQETEYVWWNRDRRTYITSHVIRALLNQQQMLEDPEGCVNQHQRAIKMYKGWVDEYPEASEDFILEIWFHEASVYRLTGDIDALHEQIGVTLEIALENLSFDRINTLFNQLQSDRELDALLPNEVGNLLQSKLDHVLHEDNPLLSSGF